MYFFKNCRVQGLHLGCIFKFRFKVYLQGLGLRIRFRVQVLGSTVWFRFWVKFELWVFMFWVQVLRQLLGLVGLGFRFWIQFQAMQQGSYANPSVSTLSLVQSEKSNSPNGKITPAVPFLLMPNGHFLVKFCKCQKAVSILPHEAKALL